MLELCLSPIYMCSFGLQSRDAADQSAEQQRQTSWRYVARIVECSVGSAGPDEANCVRGSSPSRNTLLAWLIMMVQS